MPKTHIILDEAVYKKLRDLQEKDFEIKKLNTPPSILRKTPITKIIIKLVEKEWEECQNK